ncbi:uncharacterized protein LOC131067802 isoform X2 [Cryptomeria japonica]|uniref:uncharacterized protein LOC131067802 isoform X2 n=1 Tax=Cryptomeria japonica TaxID=3369 RepID=UPI0027DA7C38|nr:uncharacterized protein LOC131067802 isoform X2 [Cryptomeria japonica]
MGKFSFPSWCFSSSLLPQGETIAGPSTFPPSSQQPANAGPPLSSQPSQQPAKDGPSTTTAKDLESFLHTVNEVSQLHDLLKFIEDLLKIESGEKCEQRSSSEVSSYIQDGQTLLEFADKHIGKLPPKKDSIDGLSAEIQKILIDLLKGAGKIHWVGAALSVVGFVLARYVGIDSAREEVIRLLDLSAQHTSPQAVTIHGFGGIGKTTQADDVYKHIDLQSYKHCRIHIAQHCTKNDLRALQEQILNGLFNQNIKLRHCDEGRGFIWLYLMKII